MGEMAFPIHACHRHLLANVPFYLIDRHREQCLKNHNQTPEELARRGGLSLCELIAVLQDRPWKGMVDGDALRLVQEHMTLGR